MSSAKTLILLLLILTLTWCWHYGLPGRDGGGLALDHEPAGERSKSGLLQVGKDGTKRPSEGGAEDLLHGEVMKVPTDSGEIARGQFGNVESIDENHGEVSLAPKVEPGGTFCTRVSGVDGEPLGGVSLSIRWGRASELGGQDLRHGRRAEVTDRDGKVCWGRLSQGMWHVVMNDPTGGTSCSWHVYVPEVGQGEVAEVTLECDAGITVSGKVVGGLRDSLEDVWVVALSNKGCGTRRVAAGRDGHFRISGLCEEEWTVYAQVGSWGGQSWGGRVSTPAPELACSQHILVTGNEYNIELQLSPSSSVCGAVEGDSIGRLQLACLVSVHGAMRYPMDFGSDGSFCVAGLRPGEYVAIVYGIWGGVQWWGLSPVVRLGESDSQEGVIVKMLPAATLLYDGARDGSDRPILMRLQTMGVELPNTASTPWLGRVAVPAGKLDVDLVDGSQEYSFQLITEPGVDYKIE